MNDARGPDGEDDDDRARPLFTRRADVLLRTVIALLFVGVLAGPALLMAWVRTPDLRRQYEPVSQPIPFSHPVHVTGLQVDCRYCHATVERAAHAGLPPTETCVPCHTDGFLDSRTMAPVRASLASGRAIPWQRVNGVPDYVYFNHAIHVTRGVGCETCHGRVDEMAQVYQAKPLTMAWCVDCHRDPVPALRPRGAVTAMGWQPTAPDQRAELARLYDVRRLTDCSTCHR